MTKYDQVDVLLSQQIPGWQNDWLDSWLVEKAKARWADSHPLEQDGSQEHADFITDYMARVVSMPQDPWRMQPAASIGAQDPLSALTRSRPNKRPKVQARTNMSVRVKPCG
jgi:hypothetical protein